MADAPTTPRKIDPTVKWGAILVIGLMLLSGVAVYFGSQSTSNPDPNNPNNPPAVKAYVADDVQATVTQIFSTAIVGGQTSQSDKTEIDEALQQIPGVQSLTSQFTKINEADSLLTYVANVTLREGTDHEAFVNAVDDSGLFDAPEIYFQASVQVPTTLSAIDESGATQSITLPNPLIQGIVSSSTQVGNSISGRLSAGFQGTQFVNAYLIETQNLSQSPVPFSFTATYPLASLENGLTATGSLPYFPELSVETLQHGVSTVPGVLGQPSPLLPQVNRTLVVSLADSNTYTAALESLLAENPAQFSNLQFNSAGLSVDLNQVTLTQAKDKVRSVITSASQANVDVQFTDPTSQFLVDVNTSAGQASPVALKLKNYFATLGAEVQVYQSGFADVNSITVPDTNVVYALPQPPLQVSILPGHAIGDAIQVTLNGIAVNGQLVFVNAVEEASADSNSGA